MCWGAYQDFVKAVGEKLERAWGKKGATRLETIFRTNVQSAYGAGRYAQLTDPDVLRTRPYWLYDAVLDSRTSSLCRGLNGTIRPADDPFWDTHVPPLHFSCRSGLRSLTRQQAEARGVTETPPTAPPAAGFGSRPDPEAWGRDWAKGVVEYAQRSGWKPAFLGQPPGPADYGLPEQLPLEPLAAPLLPTAEEVGEERFLELLRESWGSLFLELADPNGTPVVLSDALLEHVVGRRDRRERFLSLVPDLVTNPSEVWLIPERSERSGAVAFRQRYLKLYRDEPRNRSVILSAEQLRGVWTGLTFFETRQAQTVNKQRSGFLRWPKKGGL